MQKFSEFSHKSSKNTCESVKVVINLIGKDRYGMEDLIAITHFLRGPEGCPWDQVQTHQSIRRNFLEEVYECCEALDTDDEELMKEELGDVLLQVLFHADIEADRGRFTLEDICDGECKKLIFRHPNVFGDATDQTWEDRKALEKGQKTHTQTLDAVSRSLPSLWRAEKLMGKAEKTGLQLYAEGDIQKQLEQAVTDCTGTPGEEALGDLLFAAVALAAKAEVDPEMALHAACERFIRRFSALEKRAASQGCSLKDCSWNEQTEP